jgi:hypothetical protein
MRATPASLISTHAKAGCRQSFSRGKGLQARTEIAIGFFRVLKALFRLLRNSEIRQLSFGRSLSVARLHIVKNDKFRAHVRNQVDTLPEGLREELRQHPTDETG